jgi:hypothetical protein
VVDGKGEEDVVRERKRPQPVRPQIEHAKAVCLAFRAMEEHQKVGLPGTVFQHPGCRQVGSRIVLLQGPGPQINRRQDIGGKVDPCVCMIDGKGQLLPPEKAMSFCRAKDVSVATSRWPGNWPDSSRVNPVSLGLVSVQPSAKERSMGVRLMRFA